MADRERAIEIECTIETQTAKAYLVVPTNTGREIWLPKSQVYDRNEIGGGKWLFSISAWIAGKNGLFE